MTKGSRCPHCGMPLEGNVYGSALRAARRERGASQLALAVLLSEGDSSQVDAWQKVISRLERGFATVESRAGRLRRMFPELGDPPVSRFAREGYRSGVAASPLTGEGERLRAWMASRKMSDRDLGKWAADRLGGSQETWRKAVAYACQDDSQRRRRSRVLFAELDRTFPEWRRLPMATHENLSGKGPFGSVAVADAEPGALRARICRRTEGGRPVVMWGPTGDPTGAGQARNG